MLTSSDPASVRADPPAPFTDRLRLKTSRLRLPLSPRSGQCPVCQAAGLSAKLRLSVRTKGQAHVIIVLNPATREARQIRYDTTGHRAARIRLVIWNQGQLTLGFGNDPMYLLRDRGR
jgi:hypothetical protein